MFSARAMLTFTVLLLNLTSGVIQADEPLEDLLSATFRITDGEHSGTCFLVAGKSTDTSKPRQVILVTAKHIFEQMNGAECELILRTRSEESGYSRHAINIKIRQERKRLWTQHPDVDVAAMRVEIPDEAATKPIPFEQLASEAHLIDRTIRVGQEAWIACFPAKLEANEAGWPVLRKGSVASHPLIPVRTTKTILVDYNVFGGDSGAPAVAIVNDRLLIIGVCSSMQRQTDRTSLPFEERVMHTPLALSIVVQAEFLRETIGFMTPES